MLWQFVRHAFTIRSECIHVMFATCSLSVCYIFAVQKYGFCVAKVWFLACKKGVFTLQKYGFCFLNVGLLQFVWNVMAIRSQRNGNPSAALSQSVSSRRGPIYRARIYLFATHLQSVSNIFAIRQQP